MVAKLTERFEDALVFAARLHRTQLRKGTNIPYVSHLLSVTALVLEAGGDEELAIAALLHDAVEDQGGLETLAEIRNRLVIELQGLLSHALMRIRFLNQLGESEKKNISLT